MICTLCHGSDRARRVPDRMVSDGHSGLSRSEAIRRAILDSAERLHRRAAIAAEAAALEADEDDRREMLEVADFMESIRAAG